MDTRKSDTYIYGKYIYAREGLAQSGRTINQSQKYIYGNVRKHALQDTMINNEMSHPFVLLLCLQVYVKI